MPTLTPEFVDPQVAADILRAALLDIRRLCRKGLCDQAAALSDAVHNVPVRGLSGGLDKERLRHDLLSYQEAYPDRKTFDYIKMLEKNTAREAPPIAQ